MKYSCPRCVFHTSDWKMFEAHMRIHNQEDKKETKSKVFFHLATIEGVYEVQAVAGTRQGAIEQVKAAYKKFHGFPFKFDDDSIRVVCMEIGQAYVDGTELKNQKY